MSHSMSMQDTKLTYRNARETDISGISQLCIDTFGSSIDGFDFESELRSRYLSFVLNASKMHRCVSTFPVDWQ